MAVGAAAELATLGSVLPFLALLSDSEAISRFPLVHRLFISAGRQTVADQLLWATVLFISVTLAAAAVRMLLLWYSVRFTYALGAELSQQIYRRTLYQPYVYHVTRNSSEVLAGISKVATVIGGVISPLVQGVVALVVASAILLGLFVIDPATASMAGGGFAVLYLLVGRLTRRGLSRAGKVVAETEDKRIQSVQEGLGGIRDVLIDGTHEIYLDQFALFDRRQRTAMATGAFIGSAPRYVIEALGMTLIAAIALWLSQGKGGLSAAVPVLGALAIGAQKLLPQMQLVYQGWATASGNWASLQDVLDLLAQEIPPEYSQPVHARDVHLTRELVLENLVFRYPNGHAKALRGISLRIAKGSRVGFIGKTGGGKSTLIDLIMGLLEPTSGTIRIDDVVLSARNRRAWHQRIAHVPQSIYLADASIAANIAFGVPAAQIDMRRVAQAAEGAQIADFVATLPMGFQTPVGERGARLSGGQRQRIGIARALYKGAEVLVLDEATSALDDATESAVMKAIDSLHDDVTILMVAHRLSTLKQCDVIFEIEEGSLKRAPDLATVGPAG